MSVNFMSRGAMLILTCHSLLVAGAASAAASPPMKACELLTVKDVQGVLGSGYTPQDVLNNEIMSICAYTKSKDNVVSIGLKKEFYDSAQILKMEQAGIKQQGGPVTTVSGLGEGAYYLLDTEKNIFQLNFGKGQQRVIVTVMTDGKPNIEAAQKLAKIAYPRLK